MTEIDHDDPDQMGEGETGPDADDQPALDPDLPRPDPDADQG